MLSTFQRHWPHYLAEAAGLWFFMTCASAFTTALRSPFSPLTQIIKDPFQQLVALGILMGFVIVAIVYSPWGKKSGAHINPAVTLTFLRLGKITPTDAGFYIVSQFLGGLLAVQMMGLILGAVYRHPSINHVVTAAGSGQTKAFIAEFVITFILVIVMLLAANSKKTEKLVGAFAGVLIALYLMFEEPYSGMSLNPARSFASAFAARDWKDLWIFFIAPPFAALLATQVFLLRFNAENLPQHPMEEEKESTAQITVETDCALEPPIVRTYNATP